MSKRVAAQTKARLFASWPWEYFSISSQFWPIFARPRGGTRTGENGRELREVTYVPLVHWSAGWSWNSRATRGGHFQLFFIHNIERWRCEDWLWMGKIVTGLCNSNSVIEQLFVYTLLANDFMACEIVCRQVKWAQRARNALVSHLTKLFTTVVSECTFNRKQKMRNKDRCMIYTCLDVFLGASLMVVFTEDQVTVK